jgi:hypothetical protein
MFSTDITKQMERNFKLPIFPLLPLTTGMNTMIANKGIASGKTKWNKKVFPHFL